MAHVKKMVLQGFKSFAKRTEIIFDDGINTIVGPNGSGKSNITDALCFVLGRLSIKSMRAAKAGNMIFMGSKFVKPAKEASVEIVFDNNDRAFSMDNDEIIIKRAVRRNGQSIYKINDETKTRSEIIELLAHAGIDPYGFNLVLQGEIQSVVRMHGEERRKIIEEVAGISIYESRKEKATREMEKTEERLKEISTVLRERTSFLNQLEKEKAQAQKHNELKLTGKRLRASILKRKLDDKNKDAESILKSIEEKTKVRDKERARAEKVQLEIDRFAERINQISKTVQKATGVEQGKLREEITLLKTELEGLKVRKEHHESRREETERRIGEMEKQIPEMENEIRNLRNEKPGLARKANELKKKKDELAELEKERKKALTVKSELNNLKERINDKQKQLTRSVTESEGIVKQIEEISESWEFANAEDCLKALEKLREKISEGKNELNEINEIESGCGKEISVAEAEIKRSEEIKGKVEKIDTCPLCQSKMTESHVRHVFKDCDDNIEIAKKKLESASQKLESFRKERINLSKGVNEMEKKVYSHEKEIIGQKNADEKRERLRKLVEGEKELRKEIKELDVRRAGLEGKGDELGKIEEKYENKILEIEEISSRTEEDLDTTLLYKSRELEKIKGIVDRSREDFKDINEQIEELSREIDEREERLSEFEAKEEELERRFEKLYKEREETQRKVQEENVNLMNLQNETRQIEEQINYLRIGKAKIDGEKENFEIDMEGYRGIEIIAGTLNVLEERLEKTQTALEEIGSINMRALEVYEEVKKEYDVVKEKVDTLSKEKEEVFKIIEEIDKRKYKTFMKTFKAINDLFSRNFSKLYVKGTAYLEVENKDDIFAGGVDIVVKMAKGKYFDVNSLSGGEKTLVALALLFAIQEYRPYQFYVLDEIDAALDKRNSERLAALLNQYMKSGQYIVITHNDAIILNSQLLYGVSMHEGVSKIISLQLENEGK